MAAWVRHHGDKQSPDVRRGLYIALERAWPRTRGVHKHAEHRRLFAYQMHLNGASIGDIAFAFDVQLDTVQGWNTATEREIDDEGDTSPRIEVADPDGGEPEDPSDIGYVRSLLRSPAELKAYLDADARRGSI